MRLVELPFNKKAIIKHVDERIGSRLAAMGLIPGEKVEIIRASPLADPLELKIKNYNLSLRKSECKLIEVEEINGG